MSRHQDHRDPRPHQGLRQQRQRRARPARHRPDGRGGRVRGAGRPVGLGQVDADGDPRLPRLADRRHLRARRPAGPGPLGRRAGADPQREDRLRLPELQPAAQGVDRAQRRAADALRRRRPARSGAGGRCELLEQVGIPEKADVAARRSSPAASGSASRSPARSPTARRCCSPTSPPAPSTRKTGEEVLALFRELHAPGQHRRAGHPRPARRRPAPSAGRAARRPRPSADGAEAARRRHDAPAAPWPSALLERLGRAAREPPGARACRPSASCWASPPCSAASRSPTASASRPSACSRASAASTSSTSCPRRSIDDGTPSALQTANLGLRADDAERRRTTLDAKAVDGVERAEAAARARALAVRRPGAPGRRASAATTWR